MSRNPNCLPLFLIIFLSLLLRSLSQGDFCEDRVSGNQVVVNQPIIDELSSGAVSLRQFVECLRDGGLLLFEEPLDVTPLQIESSIRIQGSSGEAISSLSCRDGPIFLVNATDVQLSNLEISGCRQDSEDAPVVLLSGSSMEMNSVNFTNNTNGGGSAALKMESESELVVQGCHFNGNNGTWGTIHVTDGNTLNISSSNFVNNIVYLGGGALQIESEQRRTTIVIDGGSEFKNNEATAGEGGAILAIGNVRLTIGEDTIFRRNKAANQGGALRVRGSSSVRIEDVFFIENESEFIGGGAIYAEKFEDTSIDIHISNTIFSKNSAKNRLGSGGAIRLQGPNVTCSIELGVSFISNVAEFDGAAIHVSDGVGMNVNEAFFIGNEAHHGGGAALFAVSSLATRSNIVRMVLRIQSTTFLHNRAIKGIRGGGAMGFTTVGTDVYLERCRFHANECVFGSGAAAFLFEGSSLTVRNSSFMDNAAIWGGALFAQKQARYNVTECLFRRNTAERGGAISVRGAITLDVTDSELSENSASESGGAIRAENYIYWRVERARFRFINNTVANNNAGYDLDRNAADSEVTRGGGILVLGAGEYVEIYNSRFRNNSASEGGALAAIRVRQLQITGDSIFEVNRADFGGGLFVFVDNDMEDIFGGLYRIKGAEFLNNVANSDGGAVRIRSAASSNDRFPRNADERSLRFIDCVFRNNEALNVGGGMMVTGVGVEFINAEFMENTATQDAGLLTSGSGGGMAVIDGASISISSGNIRDNVAHTSGGGLFVMDSSVAVFSSNFTRNRVRGESGNGGAVTLMLASNRLIPRLESGPYRLPVLFRCNDCRFVSNEAKMYGGAIYHHHSDPRANYLEVWNCENLNVTTFDELQNSSEFNSTCSWIIQTRDRLRNRHIRLSRVQFIRNSAQSGAGIFTNHPDTIYVTDGNQSTIGILLKQAVNNSNILTDAGIIFSADSTSNDSYGSRYASPPVQALLFREETAERENGSSTLTFPEFRSGDRVRFYIEFKDAFEQPVSTLANFSGEISFDRDQPGNDPLELSGQTIGTMDQDGRMRFTGTRLAGRTNITYLLKLQFLLEGQDLVMEEPLNISVTMRPCRIGEFSSTDGDVIQCIDCPAGTFNSKANRNECESCQDIEGGRCFGRAVVPEDHYWHSSSFSLKMIKCIGQEACVSNDRFNKLNRTETEAHLRGENISYTDGDNTQCAEGYEGALCGSCASRYGREGEMCQKCASRGLRVFLLSMLILWSLTFVGYFIRSVLQLSKRIEFNKRFLRPQNPAHVIVPPRNRASTGNHHVSSQQPRSEIQPADSDEVALAINTIVYEETNTFPVPAGQLPSKPSINLDLQHLGIGSAHQGHGQGQGISSQSRGSLSSARPRRRTRLVSRFQQMRNNTLTRNASLLTLANPVSEVLKILINFLQVTSLAVSVNVQWTQKVRQALVVLGAAGNLATGSEYFSLDCFMNSDDSLRKSLKRMTTLVLFPIIILLFFAFFWAIRTLTKQRTRKYLKQRTWLSSLSICYFFYVGMTKNLLRFFACVRIEEEEDSSDSQIVGLYWEEDTYVECFKEQHGALIGALVVPLICAVAIGFPLLTLIILLSNARRLDDEDFASTYGFLYRAYKQPYWEILILARKGLIAAVAVFAYALGGNVQGLLCVLVLMVSLALHLTVLPFKAEMHRLNFLETASLSTTIAIFVFGLLFNDSKMNEEARLMFTILVILSVVCTLILLLTELLLASEELIEMLLVENGVIDAEDLLDQRLSFKLAALVKYYLGKMGLSLNRSAKGASSGRNPVQNQTTGVQMTNQTLNA